jgi:S-adenosylmethionine:tRNA ribosyltransferase-isomerase
MEQKMLVSDFSFTLPDGLIARFPATERDSSRLMVLDRSSGTRSEASFSQIAGWLRPEDLLVLNDTKVIPARLFGQKQTGGRVEIFLVEAQAGFSEEGRGRDNLWRCLLRASKACKAGQCIQLPDGVTAEIVGRSGEQDWMVCFHGSDDFESWLQQIGQMPIPPYLNRESTELDRVRYQTVYASEPGAVAAPTAGLHFTPELLQGIQDAGVRLAKVTLHIGLGTFQPIRVKRVQDHIIHGERYCIPAETAAAVAATKQRGGRVVAVGTTACRTLEYAADADGTVKAGQGEADIFIYPGYRFKVVDALVTNFHLPESTLLMLVSAFAGQAFVLDAYRSAVQENYRFYSYGDAMLIV